MSVSMFLLLLLLVAVTVVVEVNAQIPCDDVYGTHCADSSSWAVGDCLKALPDDSLLSQECRAFVDLHDICRGDIDTHCAGKEFTGDALVCLSEWTKAEDLSEVCRNALPKKEKKEKTLTAEQKKKAAQRKKIRNKAAKMAREF